MDDWEKCNETQLPEKEEFYSSLKYRRYHKCRLHACEKNL